MHAYLLVLGRHLVPALVYLEVDSVGLELLVRPKSSLEVSPDDWARSLCIQEGGSQGLLGGVGVFLLLLALALGALDWLAGLGSFGLVAGGHGLGNAIGSRGGSLDGGVGGGCNLLAQRELVEDTILASDDGVGVLEVGAQELVQSALDMGEAGLEVAERDNDLLGGETVSSVLGGNGRWCRVAARGGHGRVRGRQFRAQQRQVALRGHCTRVAESRRPRQDATEAWRGWWVVRRARRKLEAMAASYQRHEHCRRALWNRKARLTESLVRV